MSAKSLESKMLHSGDQEATHAEVRGLQQMLLFFYNYKFTALQ